MIDEKITIPLFAMLVLYLAHRYIQKRIMREGSKSSYETEMNNVLNGEQFKVKGRFDE